LPVNALQKELKSIGGCPESVAFAARYKNRTIAWQNYPEPQGLLWFAGLQAGSWNSVTHRRLLHVGGQICTSVQTWLSPLTHDALFLVKKYAGGTQLPQKELSDFFRRLGDQEEEAPDAVASLLEASFTPGGKPLAKLMDDVVLSAANAFGCDAYEKARPSLRQPSYDRAKEEALFRFKKLVLITYPRPPLPATL
jgi:hypothetical protein